MSPTGAGRNSSSIIPAHLALPAGAVHRHRQLQLKVPASISSRLPGHVNRRHAVVPRNGLMRRDRGGNRSPVVRGKHPLVHKMRHDHIDPRIEQPRMAQDPFHPTDALLPTVTSILIVVHRELHEKQIHRPLAEHVALQPKCARNGSRGTDTGADEAEFRLRKPPLQDLAHHRAIPIHLRDGSTEKGDTPPPAELNFARAFASSPRNTTDPQTAPPPHGHQLAAIAQTIKDRIIRKTPSYLRVFVSSRLPSPPFPFPPALPSLTFPLPSLPIFRP